MFIYFPQKKPFKRALYYFVLKAYDQAQKKPSINEGLIN